MEEQLRSLWYAPSTGLASATALYRRAREAGLKVTRAQVGDFVRKQETAQVFVRRKVKHHFPLVAYRPLDRIQLDLTDVSPLSRWNGGVKFLMLAIDVYPLCVGGSAEIQG
jgi:hypothetical protein